MNGQTVEGRGWGEAVKGSRITWFYKNLSARRSCGYQEKAQLTDSTNKGMDRLTKGDTGVPVLRAYR